MIRVCEIKLNALENTDALPARIEQRLHLPSGTVESVYIAKESIDARQKPNIFKVYSLNILTKASDDFIASSCKEHGIKYELVEKEEIEIPKSKLLLRPVVVGSGPCGMFAALILAKAGANPIILERGSSVDERVRAVEEFWKTGKLNLNTNAQFGEGGAGTFSDGKLNTGTKSKFQGFVLESFVRFGAAPEILYKQKPHIGTDVLRTVVKNIRFEIESLGGEYRFNTTFLNFEDVDGKVTKVFTDKGEIDTNCLILATGHSARDTVRSLLESGVTMEQKQFSMGIRIEHSQDLINKSQYGCAYSKIIEALGPADYKLNMRTSKGRGVYTFCMCPGGYVVNASSHDKCVVCNGMSNYKRDSGKANSAVLVDVRPSDFDGTSISAGIDFQEKYENLAYELSSSYHLPKESYSEFKKNSSIVKKCLPSFVYESLLEGIPAFGRKIRGFDNDDAIIYGLESRSSSPVRILRSESGQGSIYEKEIDGFYPAGEGAGYAGGIMSAACDGIKTALKILTKD